MPVYYIIEGVKIEFFYNDHNPPHFHASIAEHEALVSIKTQEILKGNLPNIKRKKVLEWAASNKTVLLEIWNKINEQY